MNNKVKIFLATVSILVLLVGLPSSVINYNVFADDTSKSKPASKDQPTQSTKKHESSSTAKDTQSSSTAKDTQSSSKPASKDQPTQSTKKHESSSTAEDTQSSSTAEDTQSSSKPANVAQPTSKNNRDKPRSTAEEVKPSSTAEDTQSSSTAEEVKPKSIPVKVIQPKSTWEFNQVKNSDYQSLFGDASVEVVKNAEGTSVSSLALDGDGDFVKIKNIDLSPDTTEMTMAVWVKPDYSEGSSEFTIASKKNSFALTINNLVMPEKIAKFSVFDGIKWTTVESRSTIPSDEWTHIAASFDEMSVKIYVNGVIESSKLLENDSYIHVEGIDEAVSSSDIVIGTALNLDTSSKTYNMFSGMIDTVSFNDYQMDPLEIAHIYNQGMQLEKEEYLPSKVTSSDNKIQLTLSALIEPDYSKGSPEFTILSKDNAFVLSLNKLIEPEKKIKFEVYDGSSWSTVEGTNIVENGKPTHIAAVIDDTEISLYQDGILETTATLDGIFALGEGEGEIKIISSTDIKTNSKIDSVIVKGALFEMIRSDVKIKNEFSGQIYDVAVYNEAFDKDAIKKIFSEYKGMNENSPSPPKIEFDHTKYDIESVAFLKVEDQISNNPSVVDIVFANVESSSDPNGVSVLLKETGLNTGTFRGEIMFTSEATDSFTAKLHVEENDQITAKYSVKIH